jgi:hypothetical protein
MTSKSAICCGLWFLIFWVVPLFGIQAQTPEATSKPYDGMMLVRAVMCETIDNFEPVGLAVVFPVEAGKVSCYTAFKGIADTTFVIHKWYRRDELVTTKRLTLKTPSWATYSSIQLREADKGPWRVEILNSEGQLIKLLRFSIAD